jgi:HEAT repeat protein
LVHYRDHFPLPDDPMRVLLEGLEHEDSHVRYLAAENVFVAGRAAPAAIPRLAALIDDSDRSVREAAIKSLGLLGVRQVIPRLIHILRHEGHGPNYGIRASATAALIDLNAREAVPVLRECLRDRAPDFYATGLHAYIALNDRENHGPEIARFLACETKHHLPRVRVEAARALRRLGTAAVDVLGDLRCLLSDSHVDVRWAAAQTLLSIYPEERRRMIPLLRSMLEESDGEIREWAAEELLHTGWVHARTAVMHDNVSIRVAMANALADQADRSRPSREEPFAALLDVAAEDKDLAVRVAALRGLEATHNR